MNPLIEIDPKVWRELNQLLDDALDVPLAGREAWLASLDESRRALATPLRDLLTRAAQVETRDFLDTVPKIGEGAKAEPAPATERTGDVIGAYRLIREIGSGGMGAVWLAERADGLLQRTIALKLPHGAWRSAGLAERMARERKILAGLDHPNIARLYDAGLTDAGQPFLALEFVDGVPVDQYCRAHALDTRARLGIFLQMARAVASAHAQLVVHRDLKPSNVLVTQDGQVRLLDFGIAKLLEDGQARETHLTELSGRALTPDYASPEQILGEPLTVASDVYSLGVILYELLTENRPYKLKRESRGALEEAILQTEPVRPSDATFVATTRATLRGDLDAIVLKALRKDSAERYATVNAFIDDLNAYLENRPVLAQPESAAYRARKFIARHRLGVAAAAAVLMAIVAGAAVALWQARVAIAERNRAEEVKTFIASIFRDADPWFGPQTTPSAVDLLKRARAKIEARFASPTPTRFELMNVLGESLLHVQDLDTAEAIENAVLKEATPVLGAGHLQTLRAHRLLAQVYRSRGQPDKALAELGKALPAITRRPEDHPQEAVDALLDHAQLTMDKGRFDDAIGSMKRVLALTAELPGDWAATNVVAWKSLAEANEYKRDKPQALDAAKRAYALAEALYARSGGHPDLINARLMYARQLADGGDQVSAIRLTRESIAEAERLFGAESRAVGEYVQTITVMLAQAGELKQARESGKRAAAIFAKYYEPESPFIGPIYDTNGYVALMSRDGDAAIENYAHVLPIVTREYGPTHEITYTVQMYRGLALAIAGRMAEASKELEAVAAGYAKTGYAGMSGPYRSLSELHRLQGDFEGAAQFAQQSLDALDPSPGSDAARMRVLTELGLNLVELGRYAEAVPHLTRALEIYPTKQSAVSPQRIDAMVALGRAHLGMGDAAKAMPYLEQAVEFWRKFNAESRWAGDAGLWFGRCQVALGRSVDGRENLRRARAILARSPFPADRRLLVLAQT
jgi:serine/threonine-protein kinase